MPQLDLRVLVGAEDPGVRELFKRVVQSEAGLMVEGEAENLAGLMALVKNMSPDIVLLDYGLPYVDPKDGMVSRADANAHTVAAQLPGARAILVTNLHSLSPLPPGSSGRLFRQEADKHIPLTLRGLYNTQTVGFPVLAGVEPLSFGDTVMAVEEVQEMMPFSTRAIYFGGIGVLIGGATLFTVVFAPLGVGIAAAGVCAILFGLSSKLFHRLTRPRLSRLSKIQ